MQSIPVYIAGRYSHTMVFPTGKIALNNIPSANPSPDVPGNQGALLLSNIPIHDAEINRA